MLGWLDETEAEALMAGQARRDVHGGNNFLTIQEI